MGELFGRAVSALHRARPPGRARPSRGRARRARDRDRVGDPEGQGCERRFRCPVLVLTHPAREAALRAALERIDALPDVTAPTRLVRIERGCDVDAKPRTAPGSAASAITPRPIRSTRSSTPRRTDRCSKVAHDMRRAREDARRGVEAPVPRARHSSQWPYGLGRAGARRSGCCPTSTTSTSCRCTRATRTCSGRRATGASSASTSSGSSSAATRTPARSRTSG
jgi:hypothetical protein